MKNQLYDLLQKGAAQLLLPIDKQQIDQLLLFATLMEKWNQTHNLTAITNPTDVVSKHFLDSLGVSNLLPSGSVLDVGSGGGLPGVPLAIMNNQTRFTLIDSNLKKVVFLKEVKRQLALTNIFPIHGRVESFTTDMFPVITCRAFSSLSKMLQQTQHLLTKEGCWLAMKGAFPAKEITEVSNHFDVRAVHKINVPGLDAERHVVEIGRMS